VFRDPDRHCRHARRLQPARAGLHVGAGVHVHTGHTGRDHPAVRRWLRPAGFNVDGGSMCRRARCPPPGRRSPSAHHGYRAIRRADQPGLYQINAVVPSMPLTATTRCSRPTTAPVRHRSHDSRGAVIAFPPRATSGSGVGQPAWAHRQATAARKHRRIETKAGPLSGGRGHLECGVRSFRFRPRPTIPDAALQARREFATVTPVEATAMAPDSN